MIKCPTTSSYDPLDSIGYPCTRASDESSTMKHRILHASGPHSIPPPDDPNGVDSSPSDESSTMKHRILHASGPHSIPPPDDPNGVDPRLLRQTALEVLTRSARTDSPRKTRPEQIPAKLAAAATAHGGGGSERRERGGVCLGTCVTLNGSGIQLAVGPQPLWIRNHNSGPAQRIMVKRLATSPHDPLGITDSACKNQSVVLSVLYGPFNPYIPIRSTTIGKSRVARDPIAIHTSWRSNSDIASVTSQKSTQICTVSSQHSSGLVNTALDQGNSDLANSDSTTEIQIRLRKFRFRDVHSDSATQIQIWRRRITFGDANSHLVTQNQIPRRRFRFGDAESHLVTQIQIW
ncbi:hypothetical protein F511_14797 [Dorcoceras hygrometricum]|uniref:Uncharacterized protein n=1 Tax=Dorcoceras hygrometricum TaxID=472368 RepID=A0A2Z7BQP7_9LAMI|nr:hypothetical protein F511_14797 [Dorcoceras hygrometricum]